LSRHRRADLSGTLKGAPLPAVTACSEPPWWSAEAATPGQINGSAGRRPWHRDL